ncbi:hypothetical protein M378DRAFT_161700 [Amanita muscaria Koide BX008]|uniref:Uncharacterized protein n=1 Tax=Amanita muscaria (strain Koide BX008) TaxID=946122 RepID=A0A0C2X8S6_AMAMK|nr:hypothetical protein M378DRAFT_161700 [Amanita muscaria Koide BX008]
MILVAQTYASNFTHDMTYGKQVLPPRRCKNNMAATMKDVLHPIGSILLVAAW